MPYSPSPAESLSVPAAALVAAYPPSPSVDFSLTRLMWAILGVHLLVEIIRTTRPETQGEPSDREIWYMALRIFAVLTVALWIGSTPAFYSLAIAAFSALYLAMGMRGFRSVARSRRARAGSTDQVPKVDKRTHE